MTRATTQVQRLLYIREAGSIHWRVCSDVIPSTCRHAPAHTAGQAHSGMLGCAQTIIAREMATLQKLLDKHVG